MPDFNAIIAKLPKPYYSDASTYIIHADCREVLPLIPSKSIDLVLTDLPYGNGTDYGTYVDTKEQLEETLSTVMPLILNVGVVSMVTSGVGNMFSYPKPDWVLCWHWEGGNGSTKWGFNNWQPILTYGADPYLANGMGRRQDYIQSKPFKENFNIHHPCPKPQGVWDWLLLRGSVKTTDIILDPFLGSGSTTYCAKKLGRKSIGIELNEKFCEVAAQRCSQGVMRLEV